MRGRTCFPLVFSSAHKLPPAAAPSSAGRAARSLSRRPEARHVDTIPSAFFTAPLRAVKVPAHPAGPRLHQSQRRGVPETGWVHFPTGPSGRSCPGAARLCGTCGPCRTENLISHVDNNTRRPRIFEIFYDPLLRQHLPSPHPSRALPFTPPLSNVTPIALHCPFGPSCELEFPPPSYIVMVAHLLRRQSPKLFTETEPPSALVWPRVCFRSQQQPMAHGPVLYVGYF